MYGAMARYLADFALPPSLVAKADAPDAFRWSPARGLRAVQALSIISRADRVATA